MNLGTGHDRTLGSAYSNRYGDAGPNSITCSVCREEIAQDASNKLADGGWACEECSSKCSACCRYYLESDMRNGECFRCVETYCEAIYAEHECDPNGDYRHGEGYPEGYEADRAWLNARKVAA